MIAFLTGRDCASTRQRNDRQAFFVLIVGDEPTKQNYGVLYDLAT
jgi:hypothetical protein